MCTLLGAALLICGLVYILGWLVRRREGGISAFTLIPGVVLSGLGIWLMTSSDSVIALVPVSYTHLDVYKRQDQDEEDAPGVGNGGEGHGAVQKAQPPLGAGHIQEGGQAGAGDGADAADDHDEQDLICLLYTSPAPGGRRGRI